MLDCRYYEMCARRAGSRALPRSCDARNCWMFRPMPDVDALLALASGLEADADRILRAARNARFGGGPRMGEAKHDAYEWRSIARRIREACGEVDG